MNALRARRTVAVVPVGSWLSASGPAWAMYDEAARRLVDPSADPDITLSVYVGAAELAGAVVGLAAAVLVTIGAWSLWAPVRMDPAGSSATVPGTASCICTRQPDVFGMCGARAMMDQQVTNPPLLRPFRASASQTTAESLDPMAPECLLLASWAFAVYLQAAGFALSLVAMTGSVVEYSVDIDASLPNATGRGASSYDVPLSYTMSATGGCVSLQQPRVAALGYPIARCFSSADPHDLLLVSSQNATMAGAGDFSSVAMLPAQPLMASIVVALTVMAAGMGFLLLSTMLISWCNKRSGRALAAFRVWGRMLAVGDLVAMLASCSGAVALMTLSDQLRRNAAIASFAAPTSSSVSAAAIANRFSLSGPLNDFVVSTTTLEAHMDDVFTPAAALCIVASIITLVRTVVLCCILRKPPLSDSSRASARAALLAGEAGPAHGGGAGPPASASAEQGHSAQGLLRQKAQSSPSPASRGRAPSVQKRLAAKALPAIPRRPSAATGVGASAPDAPGAMVPGPEAMPGAGRPGGPTLPEAQAPWLAGPAGPGQSSAPASSEWTAVL